MIHLNRSLFVISLILYFLAGLSLVITGGVAHAQATQFSNISGSSLASGAGFIIALGVIIIVLSVVGVLGTYKSHVVLLKIFIGILSVIQLLQLIAAIVAFTLHDKAEIKLHKKLIDSLSEYKKGNKKVKTEWDHLQQAWACCGVDNAQDWEQFGKLDEPPVSCCFNKACSQLPSNNNTGYFHWGCYQSARNIFIRYSKALGGVAIFFLFVEITGCIFGILLLRDLKHNYGSV